MYSLLSKHPPYVLSSLTLKFQVPSSQFCLEQNPQFLGLHPLWAAALPRPLRPLGQLWPLGHSAFGLYMLGFHIKENFENNRNDLGVALYLHIFTRYEKTRNGSIFIIPTPCSLLNHFSEAFLGIMWEKAKAITELTR